PGSGRSPDAATWISTTACTWTCSTSASRGHCRTCRSYSRLPPRCFPAMGPASASPRIDSYMEQPYMNMLTAKEVGLPVERDSTILEASESNLIATVLDPACRTLLITAPNSGGGGTTSALTLAQQLAMSSTGKVLLVDASPSPRGLTSMFQLNGAPGLLDLLAGDDMPERLNQCVYPHPDQPFDLLPLGVPQGRNR